MFAPYPQLGPALFCNGFNPILKMKEVFSSCFRITCRPITSPLHWPSRLCVFCSLWWFMFFWPPRLHRTQKWGEWILLSAVLDLPPSGILSFTSKSWLEIPEGHPSHSRLHMPKHLYASLLKWHVLSRTWEPTSPHCPWWSLPVGSCLGAQTGCCLNPRVYVPAVRSQGFTNSAWKHLSKCGQPWAPLTSQITETCFDFLSGLFLKINK